ncbi:MAG: hypothetical protein ACI4S9_05845, partial [Christensenellales bacterium]
MKVMILSMVCGEGHNAYARTILRACQKHGHETEFVDIFEFDKYSHNLNNKGYQFLCKYLALPYDMIWKAQLTRDPDKRYKGAFQSWIIKAGKYVLEKLLEFRPDAVFSTHYYASAIMTNIKRKNLYNVRDYALLTDYMAHPNWEASVLLDRLFIPTQDTIPRLIDKGFSMKQLFISGLPVSDSFKLNVTKEEARENAVAGAVRQPLHRRAPLRVGADQVARPRLLRRERMLDRLRDRVGRNRMYGRALCGEPTELPEALPVALGR